MHIANVISHVLASADIHDRGPIAASATRLMQDSSALLLSAARYAPLPAMKRPHHSAPASLIHRAPWRSSIAPAGMAEGAAPAPAVCRYTL
jgi:hypothetical protein